MEEVKVSIIIVNYNTTALTRACIESIIRFTKIPFELIVVDNASIDRSIEQLQVDFPELKLILNQENIGFGRANNLGIACSKAEFLFLLNSDTLLTSDAVGSFLDYMQQPENQMVAGCGGALIKADGSDQISYGNFPSIAEVFTTLGPGLFYKRYYKRHLSSGVKVYLNEPFQVDYISGADLFIRKSVLKDTGVFDEDFFLYFEETELAFRMRKKGYLQYILPNVKIIHHEGGSGTGDKALQKKQLFAKNRSLFFKKCYGNFTATLADSLYSLQKLIYRQ